MTIPVVAVLMSKKGDESALEALFRQVIDIPLAEEGCITYQLNRDSENKGRFIGTEEWENLESWHKHLTAPHHQQLFAMLPESM